MSSVANIQSLPSSPAAQSAWQQQSSNADFAALLDSFGNNDTTSSAGSSLSTGGLNMNILAFAENGDSIGSLINGLIGNIQSHLQMQSTGVTLPGATPTFPLSADFQATFGSSGPLIDWINVVTAGLNLSADKNQALQHIAVENKDTTGSSQDVQKIAQELQAAGIG
jgi:hypothetical protein